METIHCIYARCIRLILLEQSKGEAHFDLKEPVGPNSKGKMAVLWSAISRKIDRTAASPMVLGLERFCSLSVLSVCRSLSVCFYLFLPICSFFSHSLRQSLSFSLTDYLSAPQSNCLAVSLFPSSPPISTFVYIFVCLPALSVCVSLSSPCGRVNDAGQWRLQLVHVYVHISLSRRKLSVERKPTNAWKSLLSFGSATL